MYHIRNVTYHTCKLQKMNLFLVEVHAKCNLVFFQGFPLTKKPIQSISRYHFYFTFLGIKQIFNRHAVCTNPSFTVLVLHTRRQYSCSIIPSFCHQAGQHSLKCQTEQPACCDGISHNMPVIRTLQ